MPSREVGVNEHEFDVVVVGMGPGGEHVAKELAKAGLAVAGIEDRLVGGECPYWGCVPSKMMIRAADLLAEGRRIQGMAGSSVISPDWAPVAKRIRHEATDSWNDKAAADQFTGVGGTLFRGRGSLAGPGLVSVADRVAGDIVLRARRGIVLNPGTSPSIPPISGLADTPYWTNRETIESEEAPNSLVVLGGGAIGSELAQVFARFGAKVTVVEALAQLLPLEEPESGSLLAAVFKHEDIAVRTGVAAQAVSHQGGQFTVKLASGEELTGDRLLVATGRRANLAGLGLAAIGLDASARTIETDEHLRAAPGVWAIGDVTGRGAFTHMSMYQAGIVIDAILGRPHHPAEYHAVPRVTFTDPEIGSVGLTEAQAREEYGDRVQTATIQIPHSTRGWIHKAGNDGLIKLVADGGRGVLVGATSAGPVGGEVLSMLTLAVHAAVPVQRLREMIYAYPTFHRAVEDALSSLD
jgi:pyruvate/2-oxoglutarate dehydrogenase complex dihydrolipoamide dehydrogenase (E3) component